MLNMETSDQDPDIISLQTSDQLRLPEGVADAVSEIQEGPTRRHFRYQRLKGQGVSTKKQWLLQALAWPAGSY